MDAFLEMKVFFLISSVGFVIVSILAAIVLWYFIRAMNTCKRIMEKAEKDIDKIGDTTKDMLEDLRDSVIFRFLFKKKKKRGKE
jgi:hypothetical protein